MKFSCEKCFYSTDSKCYFESHKKSKTHIKRENNEFEENYKCKICNKTYKSNVGLWKHKKICESAKKRKDEEEIRKIVIELFKQNNEMMKENNELKNLFIKENTEMKNMLVELSKKDFTKIENNTNNNNNKFDFNFFLDDKCKNAVNMSYLIETILVTVKDIENLEKNGYVKTLTDMVVEKLNNYSVYERPIHYFIGDKPNNEENDDDEPNEIIHIKENDRWNKEDMSEHDVLLTNLNTLNDVFQQKTKGKETANQEVKSGRRYNKTGKIITNILETVKINDENIKEL